MVREVLNNQTSAIEKLYYRHGMFCSCHAYRVITCTCLIIVLMRLRRSQFECKYHLNSDTVNTMFFSIGIFCSPLIHGNAVIEWRPESSSRAPPWLSEEPLASVQHVMLQLKHKNPFEVTCGVCDVRFDTLGVEMYIDLYLYDKTRMTNVKNERNQKMQIVFCQYRNHYPQAIKSMFALEERILKVRSGSVSFEDLCYKTVMIVFSLFMSLFSAFRFLYLLSLSLFPFYNQSLLMIQFFFVLFKQGKFFSLYLSLSIYPLLHLVFCSSLIFPLECGGHYQISLNYSSIVIAVCQ